MDSKRLNTKRKGKQRTFLNISHAYMQVQIKENSWVAKIAAQKMKADKVAIVFGKTIHLHNTSKNEFLNDKDWTCHELKHVEQYQQNGFLGFICKYVVDWIKNGYYNNRFEIEARASEKDKRLMDEVQFF